MATIKDVAKLTGFSVTTVSRALNGHTDVNEETRHKIQLAADKIGYTPNVLARTLVTKRSNTIGLLIAGLDPESAKDNFVFQLIIGINNAVSRLGFEMIILSATESSQRHKSFNQLVSERNLDGVIISGLRENDPYLIEATQSTTPVVLVDIPIENEFTGFITTNQHDSIVSIVKYLYQLGHRKIAFLNGHHQAYVSEEREKAYHDALDMLGVPAEPGYIINGNFAENTALQATLELLISHPEVTAIVSASDLMAIGAMAACKQLKLAVPEHISITGFDNIILSGYITPTLTTIAQSPINIGEQGTELLIDLIRGVSVDSHHIILNNELIVRQSTAAVR